jgi:hypothetical protein
MIKMNIQKDIIGYKPIHKIIYTEDLKEEPIYYETSWYCDTIKGIHENIKQVLNCPYCVSEQDKLEYEAGKRLEWFLECYFVHNLGSTFSKIKTEDICKNYNVEIKYFRPWSK